MNQSSERLVRAIETGELETELVPAASEYNTVSSDLYEIVLKTDDGELGRIGVWQTAAGGVVGNGAPRVQLNGAMIRVLAGDGMKGNLTIDCANETRAREIGGILEEQLNHCYDEIENETEADIDNA